MEIFLWIIAIVLIIAVGVAIYDSNRFVVREYTIESNKLQEDHDLIFLSDLHCKSFGKNNSKLLKAIDAIPAEAILIGGDMVTSTPGKEIDTPAALLEELCARMPVYYGEGNHEQKIKLYTDKYKDMYARYMERLDKIPLKIMHNEKVSLSDFDIYGLSINRLCYKRKYNVKFGLANMKRLIKDNDESRFSILLAHNHEYFEGYAAWKPDLVLSGHNHGGMVTVPFLGGLISPKFKLFPHYDGGLFEEYGSKMILGRGLGSHTIPIRFLNPGELIVIHLKKH